MVLSNTAYVLPEDFVPSPDLHWIIGRGRAVKQHNQKFDKMIREVAIEYAAAPCKAEKGTILTNLVNSIHELGPNSGFVRRDPNAPQNEGRWTLVDEPLARMTAAQALRNVLSSNYRSSKQFKSKRRIQQIKEQQEQVQAKMNNGISPLSPMSLSAVMFANRCVSPSESDSDEEEMPTLFAQPQQVQSQPSNFLAQEQDTFSLLMAKFAASLEDIPSDSNPFEPRPLACNSAAPENTDIFSPSFDFEPLPLAL